MGLLSGIATELRQLPARPFRVNPVLHMNAAMMHEGVEYLTQHRMDCKLTEHTCPECKRWDLIASVLSEIWR